MNPFNLPYPNLRFNKPTGLLESLRFLLLVTLLISPRDLPAGVRVEDSDWCKTFVLTNDSGTTVRLTNFGVRVMSIVVPDRDGNLADIILGYDSPGSYLNAADKPYFGATVGRYANRIAKGEFEIDGERFKLATNNGPNHLHGGRVGLDKVVWDGFADGESTVEFTYRSIDGEEGYPGNLDASVRYSLSEAGELKIEYKATSDEKTQANLTNHAYFNLKGEGRGTILEHELKIIADHYTPVDPTLIPTGEIALVENTPFDFTKAKPIGVEIASDNRQMEIGHGYDHNWVLSGELTDQGVRLAAVVFEPETGRVMEVLTSEPGLQFYTGNFLDGRLVGKSGKPYLYRGGFCLETQHFPDSPNQPEFPSTLLLPGQVYESQTIYRFKTK